MTKEVLKKLLLFEKCASKLYLFSYFFPLFSSRRPEIAVTRFNIESSLSFTSVYTVHARFHFIILPICGFQYLSIVCTVNNDYLLISFSPNLFLPQSFESCCLFPKKHTKKFPLTII